MRFGMIGTNFISEWFLKAGKECGGFKVSAIYSRSMDHACRYAQAHGIPNAYDSLEKLAESPDIDAVYIASPNSLHCTQTLEMLKAGKHVLCEKPIASNSNELALMQKTAKETGLLLLEAVRPVLSPGIDIIRKHLPELGEIRRVSLVYNQYSSRYDRFKNGIVENAFNPALSNGALMDIGVYCIQLMVALFGVPQTIKAEAIRLTNGLDGQGFILAGYHNMLVELSYSKISQSVVPSVIQGEEGSMLIDPLVSPKSLKLKMRNGEEKDIPCQESENDMKYEIQKFIHFAKTGSGAETYNEYSKESMRIMDEARRQQGIIFPADCSTCE